MGHRAMPLYLLSLLLPLGTTTFLVVSTHRAVVFAAWISILAAIAVADELLPPLPLLSSPLVSIRSLHRLADVVAMVQLINFALFAWRLAEWRIASLDTVAAVFVLGIGGAFSSMIAAHELIHRPSALQRGFGRALLWTLIYDQFFTEHLRGHHRTVGTDADVLTARRDETFGRYLLRTWPAEIRSAWRIETARGRTRSLLANEVVRGMIAQVGVLVGIALWVGPPGAVLVLLQAALAQFIVAAVNFFEHWGLIRTNDTARLPNAWDCTAPLSHYALLGLPFHADHHHRASKSFDRLELHEDTPKLPHGYFAMAAMVVLRGQKARELLQAGLSSSKPEQDASPSNSSDQKLVRGDRDRQRRDEDDRERLQHRPR